MGILLEKLSDSRFERVITLVDKFSFVQPNETVLSEDQLLKNVRMRSTLYPGTGYVIVKK